MAISDRRDDHDSDQVDRALVNQRRLVLALVDIGGYTEFMVSTRTSVLHAQEIIFQLLESIIERSKHPLELNKLEGDAVFLYAGADEHPSSVAAAVLDQVGSFFQAFREKATALTRDRAACSCTACSNIFSLRLKAILHVGPASIRPVQGFTELGGEDVIVIHRLLKNSVTIPEYILVTDAFWGQLNDPPIVTGQRTIERDPVLGDIPVWVLPTSQHSGHDHVSH